ncbi:MAG: MarR family transcriptional regulator [Candidatus Lustribacter sp.]|jgi:DNA-binding MarR family transcriptional regulator
MFDLTAYLPYLLNRAGFAATTAFTDALAEVSLTVPGWRVLVVLLHGDRLRVGELADRTSIEFSTLSRLIDALQRRGLVARKPAKDDARVVHVSLTARGRAVTRQLLPEAVALERRMIAGMSAAEVGDLRRLLEKLYENIRGEEATQRSASA